ncbi:MAG: glycosyltransferase family 4 protein [Thermoplasmata archaeon]
MRILRLHSWAGSTYGGVEVYLQRLSRALDARGHIDVTAALVTDPLPESLRFVRPYLISGSERRRWIEEALSPDGITHWLDRVAAEVRPDVIHLHHFKSGFSVIGPWLARRPEPVVFTAHTAELVCPIGTLTLPNGAPCPGGILPRCQFTGCEVGLGLPLNLAQRRSFDVHVRPRVGRYICVSRATRRIFDGLGYGPTALLRPPIPTPDRAAHEPTGPFTIGFFGRFVPVKGLDVLLRALRMVREQRPEVHLRLAGSGPVAVADIENLHRDGWVSDAGLWFDQIHVLVVPSLGWENLGNSAIEALGYGVPVIVSDAGGLPETVGEYGTVVPKGSPRSLADAILATASDYPARRRLAQRGRDWVRKEFSPDRHYDELLAIYESVRGHGPPRAS